MLSSSEFDNFKVQFYKGQWPGQRFGQAFVNHSGYVAGPNPVLFYDPDDGRAEGYIRRHYVYSVVEKWECNLELGRKVIVHLQMTESLHRLFNVTRSAAGESTALDQMIEVMAFDRGPEKFIYSVAAPCDGDLLFCEVV